MKHSQQYQLDLIIMQVLLLLLQKLLRRVIMYVLHSSKDGVPGLQRVWCGKQEFYTTSFACIADVLHAAIILCILEGHGYLYESFFR